MLSVLKARWKEKHHSPIIGTAVQRSDFFLNKVFPIIFQLIMAKKKSENQMTLTPFAVEKHILELLLSDTYKSNLSTFPKDYAYFFPLFPSVFP